MDTWTVAHFNDSRTRPDDSCLACCMTNNGSQRTYTASVAEEVYYVCYIRLLNTTIKLTKYRRNRERVFTLEYKIY